MTKKLSLTLLISIGFLVYLPSFWNQFLWDDEQFIYRNQHVLEFNLPAILTENTIAGAGEISNYYRPLTSLTFAMDHAIWGLQPFGFHLTNTTLHILAAVLVFLLLRQLGLKQGSFWIAALFLLHPLQTEAVTYINSRGDSLYAFLVLLSLNSFMLGIKKRSFTLPLSDRRVTISPLHMFTLSVITYVLALFSKEIAIAAVAIHTTLLVRNWLVSKASFSQWFAQQKEAVISWVILWITAISYLIARATLLNFNNSFNFAGHEAAYSSSVIVRLLTFTKTLWWYWKWLFVPYPQHMEREIEVVTSLASPWPWASLLVIISMLLLGFFEWKKKKSVWIWFGWSWFFIWLSPMSGIIPINGILYEHWLYVPMIGFWLTLYGCYKLSNLKFSNAITTHTLSALLVVAALLTIRQNYIWRAPIPFYEYTLQYANSARLHNNLAMAYDAEGMTDKAILEYQAALSISNAYPQIYYNLGNAYVQKNDLEQAEQAYLQALNLSPQFEPVYGSLINLYLNQQKYETLLPLIDTLLQTYPQQSDFWLIKGLAHFHTQQPQDAEAAFKQAIQVSPTPLQTAQIVENIKAETASK